MTHCDSPNVNREHRVEIPNTNISYIDVVDNIITSHVVAADDSWV